MKKIIIPISIVLAALLCMVLVLTSNKKKIDKAKTPIDRTNIPVSVSVANAAMELLDVNVRFPALVQPFDQANVYSQTSGMINYLNIALGQHVSKGQVIGRLDTRILEINLKNAQVEQQSAAVNKAKLLNDYNRSKDLYENKAGLEVNMLTAKNDYNNAVNNYDSKSIQISLIKQQIANAAIVSPLSGTVSAHTVKQGEYITPGTSIATITNIGSVKATVFVDQQISYQLKVGQVATITSPVFGDNKFSGKIIYTSPVADVNHNYQVDLLITNKGGVALKGGTDVQISFNTLAQKKVLQISKSALITDTKEPYVYVAENGKAKSRIIRTGTVQNDKVEVLSGLNAGEMVIINGQINLREGSSISIIK